MKKIFSASRRWELNSRTRKKLVATANRCEGVYNRAGEPSVTFCEKEEQRRERALIFIKNQSKRYKKLAPTWRRRWDSNPRYLAVSLVFKTSSLNHSDTPPTGSV